MKQIRFIHAADLHLDSQFRGLGRISENLQSLMCSATFEALSRIVTHAIKSKADFVIIAGDLYDSKDHSLRALVEFRREMMRLEEHGIEVFIAHGNHDPLNSFGGDFKMPPNVFTFGGEVETRPVIRGGSEIAQVSGISYVKERVTENLARSFKRTCDNDIYSIAVLHANIGAQSGHAPYAPASVDDLINSGFDYWALGHVHRHSVLHESPYIVYPGNPQGRNIRETEERGCVQVDVNSGTGATRLEFIDTSMVRWDLLEFSIREHSRMDTLIDGLLEKTKEIQAKFDGPTILRCRLVGAGDLHLDLQREGIREEIQEQIQSVVQLVQVESVKIETENGSSRDNRTASEPIIRDLLSVIKRAREDSSYRENLADCLHPLFRKRWMENLDASRIEELIEKAGNFSLDQLLEK